MGQQVNHTMTQLRTELELARAEIERLRALLEAKTTPGYEILATIMEKRDARIRRLTAALEQITKSVHHGKHFMIDIARRVLEQTRKE